MKTGAQMNNKYRQYYKGMSDEKLSKTLSILSGNQGTCEKTDERIAAITGLLSERAASEDETSESALSAPGDIELARKYIRKYENAMDRLIEFELTFAQFKQLMRKSKCHYFGVELTDDDPDAETHRTIDRVDAALGYTKENCVICCSKANQFKNRVLELNSNSLSITVEQFKNMASKL